MIPTSILLHHSATNRDNTTLEDINNWHKARGFKSSSLGFYVGYHFVIFADGWTKQTRRENEIGSHTIPNEGKIGICLTGNFEIEMPTSAQLASLQELLERIKKDYQLDDSVIFGHGEKNKTLCCGKNLMIWLNSYRQISILKKIIMKLTELLAILKVGK